MIESLPFTCESGLLSVELRLMLTLESCDVEEGCSGSEMRGWRGCDGDRKSRPLELDGTHLTDPRSITDSYGS